MAWWPACCRRGRSNFGPPKWPIEQLNLHRSFAQFEPLPGRSEAFHADEGTESGELPGVVADAGTDAPEASEVGCERLHLVVNTTFGDHKQCAFSFQLIAVFSLIHVCGCYSHCGFQYRRGVFLSVDTRQKRLSLRLVLSPEAEHLVAMPFAPSSVLAPLVVRPGAPSSFLLLVAMKDL